MRMDKGISSNTVWEGVMNKRYEGSLYEQKAMDYLRDKGYRILTHNYYTKYGELDIIAYKDRTYVFIEVKYRKSDKNGKPYEAVTYKKRQHIMRSSISFCQTNHILGEPMRFDIIDILSGVITHYENAFEMDKKYSNY